MMLSFLDYEEVYRYKLIVLFVQTDFDIIWLISG